MMMRGRELKQKLTALMHKHNAKPIVRAALPLLAATDHSQVVEGICASADIDADRTSFAAGALIWPDDLDQLPLLVRHDVKRTAGKILRLHYGDDGILHVRALVEDPEARRMAAFSVAVTVVEAEIRGEDSASGYHAIVHRGIIDEISLTPLPSNSRAIVTSRRDVNSFDTSSEIMQAAAIRAQRALAALHQTWSNPAPAPVPHVNRDIGPAPGLILGNVPRALLTRPKSSFTALVAQLPTGD